MTRPTYRSTINKVLEPRGFIRTGNDWKRENEAHVDIISVQSTSVLGSTINIHAQDKVSERMILDAEPAGPPPTLFPVSVRIQRLVEPNTRDRWWRAGDPNGPAEAAALIEAYALPFLERMHTLEGMADYLQKSATKWRDGTSRLHLAVIQARMGDMAQACETLRDPPKDYEGRWLGKIVSLRRQFGCGAT